MAFQHFYSRENFRGNRQIVSTNQHTIFDPIFVSINVLQQINISAYMKVAEISRSKLLSMIVATVTEKSTYERKK
jgi:hypothetical protein